MNRSIWKIPRVISNPGDNRVIPTFLRSAVISPRDIGAIVKIHNGCKFVRIKITEDFVGYKYGAFAQTKKTVYHKRKKKKK
jgi:small subunit ribosomal protein S19